VTAVGIGDVVVFVEMVIQIPYSSIDDMRPSRDILLHNGLVCRNISNPLYREDKPFWGDVSYTSDNKVWTVCRAE
jgi:hypothetical protein